MNYLHDILLIARLNRLGIVGYLNIRENTVIEAKDY